MKRLAAALTFSAAFAGTALANDSIAELGAGGIILVYADSISMVNEELFISKDEVRVDYVFRNMEDQPRTYLVACPMPEIEAPGYLESDIGVPFRETDNFMNFQVTVAGQAVEPKLEMRALTGGIDVTDRITALGIPLNPLTTATHDAINKLPRGTLQELITMGALRVYEDKVDAQWTLRTNYYWLQTFPANATLQVAHRYTPAFGSAFFYKGLLNEKDYVARYCLDNGTKTAITKKLVSRPEDNPYLAEHQIQYVLSSGANWFGPIKDFRLVVDKGSPDAVISLCMDGVKKISPTQFEVRKADFEPKQDIDIMLVEDLPKE